MPCYFPLTAFYSSVVGKSGKRGITFSRGASFSGAPLKLPCGKCAGCRLERSRQWAMRCVHEQRLHDLSCFVTLTYSADFLPPFGSLVRRDVQLFLKRLRKYHSPNKFRFFGCGEYGDENGRPHYHLILFGLDFADKVRVGSNGRDDLLYESPKLSELWGKGLCVIGSASFDSAAYVARYCMKKINGAKSDDHYTVYDSDGCVGRRLPEFGCYSLRPGIGSGWYDRYGSHAYVGDSCVINGKLVPPPRFYESRLERDNPERLAELKRVRRDRKVLAFRDNLVDRRRVKEIILLKKLEQKGRKL